jgi:hypothetical protein
MAAAPEGATPKLKSAQMVVYEITPK